MKKMIALTISALMLNVILSYAQNSNQDPVSKTDTPLTVNGPVAQYDKTTFEFGDLTQGNPGTASFILSDGGGGARTARSRLLSRLGAPVPPATLVTERFLP